MARDPELRELLLAMVAAELAAVDDLTSVAEADPGVDRELTRRMRGATSSLITALDGWDGAPPEADALREVNEANATRLAEILAGGEWPGLRTVGADGADAAWMLAQNADRSNEARRGWLPALREAVTSGDADPRHFATLTDRVAAIAGEPQIYGTIVLKAADGELEFPIPVRDAAGLDARRAEIGLPTLGAEAAHSDGELVPYGAERGDNPVNQWPMALEGHVSVEAALEGGVRRVHRIWAARPGDRRLGRLRALAREAAVVIEAVEGSVIDEVASGRTHGGVVALVGSRREGSLDELLPAVGESAIVVMLDGIEDPFNYGQAVRALYAAGTDAVVVRRSWETALGIVTRASAGATELLPTATVAGAEAAAERCRAAGFRVACAVDADDATDLDASDLTGGVFMLIGGERRGVTRSYVDQADIKVRIPYGRDRAPALGAAVAAALIAFEALRQRRAARG